MIADPLLGPLLIAGLVGGLAVFLSRRRLATPVRRLLLGGLVLRVIGSLAYLVLVGTIYGGGDYIRFYQLALDYADIVSSGDIEAMLRPWTGAAWWGTRFISQVTGLLLVVIGPTMLGVFIFFALAGYVGILSLVYAFGRAFPSLPLKPYAAWVVLFPALWFWPSALGKDAIVLCGVGLATLGFVGRHARTSWLPLALGVALVFAVRPQVAAALVFSIMVGQWLGGERRWRISNLVQGAVILAVGIGVVTVSSGAIGVELFNPDEVERYLAHRADLSGFGGSAIRGSGDSPSPWMAPVNTLLRPFPWEAAGPPAMLASAEMVLLWAMAWLRRKRIARFVRVHRRSRLLWMALVFSTVYSVALGMSLSNLGMIARQRIHVLPFLLIFIAGAPRRPTADDRPPPGPERTRAFNPPRPVPAQTSEAPGRDIRWE